MCSLWVSWKKNKKKIKTEPFLLFQKQQQQQQKEEEEKRSKRNKQTLLNEKKIYTTF